ncbi:DUF5110 domain-containing protein [Maribellus comscasis]|uniref:DUF5110 domain-containing protein n=1 Tax=Maribellus comscasis TaxID=2681766 RepID=A0A6I6JX89_9BACT|nr:DUF5110 domain-containing protein [Maribellus comscasis]QGY45738.1 DUF5110 domain-containing protein [Maribellus comscasis]
MYNFLKNGLFIKAGAIIPEWPYVDYVGQKPIDTMTVQVYPYKESNFTLIEDEGEGFGYEKGEIATTKMTYAADESQMIFTLHTTEGDYQGRVKDRKYFIHFNIIPKPADVKLNGTTITNWEYDSETKVLSVSGITNEEEKNLSISLL